MRAPGRSGCFIHKGSRTDLILALLVFKCRQGVPIIGWLSFLSLMKNTDQNFTSTDIDPQTRLTEAELVLTLNYMQTDLIF